MSLNHCELGQLVSVKTGKLDANAANENGMYPFFTCAKEPLLINRYAFDADAILVAGNGDLNVKHYKGKFNAYQRTYVITIDDPTRLCSRYLFHFMDKYVDRLREQSIGGVIKYIKLGMLTEAKLPLPTLEEQKRIAAILDKADAIRQKRQQAIALADDFLRSVFLDMFGDPVTNPKGWEIQPISKMAEVQGGLQVTKKREGLPVTYPYLRVANVYRGRLELSEIKTMQVTEAEQERVALVKNDILIVEGHGNKEEIGRCAMWDGSIENIIHQNHLIRVRVISNRILPQYLTDFINSEGGRAQLIGASNTTSGLNTISTRLVKETAVLIPDLHTQERYIKIFKKVTETLSCFQQGILGGKELFECLSQKAFSGQL